MEIMVSLMVSLFFAFILIIIPIKYLKPEKDKIKHYIVGFLISIFGLFFWPFYFLGVIVGLLKEIYDKKTKKGTPEFLDFVWTAAGSIICLISFERQAGGNLKLVSKIRSTTFEGIAKGMASQWGELVK
jgi:hypothetical protein